MTVGELVEYFTEVDKRLAWENNYLASLEQCRAFPLQTNMYYAKLKKKGSSQRDILYISHGIQIKGNRQYLTSLSVEHDEYPQQKKVQRVGYPSSCNYFEPTADGKGVKNILIFQVQAGETKDGLKQRHLQSIINLKNLLKGARQTKVGTTYLQRAEEEFKIGE